MNEQLIKLIELCLIDGVISDKERSVIFKKSEELGISKDECEIILEGMIQKHSKKNTPQPQKKKGFFGSIMDEVKKGVDEVKKNIDVDSITDKVKSIQEEYEKKVEEVTNQNLPKTTSSSKTSKRKSTTPKKVSKPKPTPSKPKKTNTKSSTSKKVVVKQKSTESKSKEGVNKPLKKFNFKSLTVRCSPGRWGTIGDYKEFEFEFKFHSSEIEVITTTKKNFLGSSDIEWGNNPKDLFLGNKKGNYYGCWKNKDKYLINDIKDISNSYGSLWIEFVGGETKKFTISEEISDLSFISEMNNLLSILKKNKVKSQDELDGLFLENTSIFKKELLNYKDLKEHYVLENNLYFDIVKTNQSKINEIDREYVQKFIKLNNYLKEKSSNLSVILDKIIYNLENEPKEFIVEREEEINFFKGLIYSYNLMVNHSIVMVTSLVEDDTITFFEIYEVFDKMNVFNTNWENEVNDKLSDINESLQDLNFSIIGLMSQMRSMEKKLVTQLQSINTSIGSLENSVNKQLSETNSRLKYDNLTSYYKKSTLPGVMDWFDGP